MCSPKPSSSEPMRRRATRITEPPWSDANHTRRLLSLAEIYDGGTRTQAARIGGVGLQVIRDWILRFNTGGPNGLIDRKAPGKAPILDQEQRRALVEERAR